MAKMTLKVKVNDTYIWYQPGVSQDAYLVEIIRDGLLRGQAEFSRILSQNGQITLKVKVSDHCFQYK